MTTTRLPLAGLCAAAALLGCGQDLTFTPVRNLERPADMDFVCMGLVPRSDSDSTQVATALPMSECHNPTTGIAGDMATASPTRTAFAVLTNSARAEVGAIRFTQPFRDSRLVDLDHRVPGYNMVPVGAQPEVLSVSGDSCLTVTANRGSCDLSLIDNSRLLAPEMGAAPAVTADSALVRQITVRTAGGAPLGAAPGEIVFVPALGSPAPPPPPPPADGGTDGPPDGGATDASADAPATGSDAPVVAPDAAADSAGSGADLVSAQVLQPPVRACTSAPQRAIVTFPGCDLVALVEVPSGEIKSSFRLMANGTLVDTGTSPTCRAECAPGPGSAATATDGGTGPAGAAPLGLSALAIMPEESRVYLGATRLPVIVTLGINEQGLVALPDSGRILLAENPGGVDRLRLSREPWRSRGERGAFVGRRGRFLYAFARDNSVRVVHINPTQDGRPLPPTECDVNIDPALFASGAAGQITRACFPVSERLPRSPLASGPGLRLPLPRDGSRVAAPVPIDVSFAEAGTDVSYFATGYLLGSDGVIYHVGLDSGSQKGEATNAIRRDPTFGAAQVTVAPTRTFGDTGVAYPTKVAFTSNFLGPRVEGFPPFQDGLENWLYFPRVDYVPRQDVQLRWEGTLPNTLRVTGRLGSAAAAGDVATLEDVGADFCDAGAEVGDVLTMLSCESDLDCSNARREVCFRATPGASGACVPRQLVESEELVRLCQSELTSRRRYEIREVWKNRVRLGLKLDEVPRPSIKPCVLGSTDPDDIAVCQPDASHRPDSSLAALGDRGFQCLDVGKAGRPRCLKPCGVRDASNRWQPNDQLCRAGHVCADVGDQELGPLCVEAPPPRQECSGGDLRYVLQVGSGYSVSFGALPPFSRVKEEPGTGRCVPDNSRNPLLVSRIPLSAPSCAPGTPARAAEIMAPTFSLEDRDSSGQLKNHNPCLVEGMNEDGLRLQAAREDPGPRVKAVFENPHARLVLTNLQQYVGDAATVDVAIGNAEAGYVPLVVANNANSTLRVGLGVRIVTGPMAAERLSQEFIEPAPPYMFVVDQGRTLQLLSRGQILLVNTRPIPTTFPGGLMEPPTTGSPFPIQ